MGGLIPDRWNGTVDDLGTIAAACGSVAIIFRYIVKPLAKIVDAVHDVIEFFEHIIKRLDKIESRISVLEANNPEGDNR